MTGTAVQTRDQLAAAYLQQLHALASELEIAMDAVAVNALAKFEDSVSNQEMLCASLVKMARVVSDESRGANRPLPSSLDPAVRQKISATMSHVQNLNLRYAALLKHSGESIALLASLCRSHTGHFREDRGARLKQQTWSCEM